MFEVDFSEVEELTETVDDLVNTVDVRRGCNVRAASCSSSFDELERQGRRTRSVPPAAAEGGWPRP